MSSGFALAVAMLGATAPLSATTFTRVDLPDPVTEATSGVNILTNTYTHAFNFGNGSTTDIDINGLLFDTKNLAATITDDNRAGNTINAAIAVAGTLGNNGGNSSVKAEAGDLKTVMQPFGFHSSAGSGTMSFTINNLNPGQPYVARFYNYQWDTTASSRTLRVSTNVDSDTADIDWGGGTRYRCFYIEVSYTPTGTSAQINFQALDPSAGAHISAITNHSAAAVAPVKWSGQTNALWNETDVNFTGQSFGGFKTSGGSKVIFADTDGSAAPVANTGITVDPAGVSIAEVDFENTATGVTYSIDAAGGNGITGPTKINKTGNGAVSLLGQHSYTSNTNLDAGTLTLDTAFLSDGSTVSIDAGATLNLTHSANDFVNSLVLDGVPQANGVYDSLNSGGRITGTGKIVVFSGGLNRWTGAADLSWENVLNWNVPLVPNSDQHTANFEFDAPAAETTITLDGSKTVGTLNFNDTSDPADGNLKFVAGVLDPSSTLTANTVTVADADRTVTIQTGNTIPMILAKNGPGALVIKDDTTTRGGDLLVNSGTLRLENATGLSAILSGGMNITGGATVVSDATVGGTWAGSTWLIGQNGTGTVVNENGAITVPAARDIAVGNGSNADGTIRIQGGSMTFAQGTGSRAWVMMGRDPQAVGTQNGRIYLEGGILETSRSFVASGSNPSTDYLTEVYLDGGTLKAESGIPVDPTYGWFQAATNGNALPLSGVYVRDAGAVFDTNGGDALIAAALLEDGVETGGGLTKQGLGTLTLSGANAYLGSTTVNAGTLKVTGSLGATAVEVKNDATLAGNGALGGSVTVRTGGHQAFEVADTVVSQITRVITGSLTLEANTIIDLTAAVPPAPGGPYVLLTATGGISGSIGSVTFSGVSGSVAINGNNLELTVTAPTGFAAWVATPAFGLAVADQDPTDDPDNDGMENLLEFVLNGNPGSSDPSILPGLVVTATDFEFTYQRRDDSVETTQTFQWGTTLATWPGSAIIPSGSFVGTATITVSAGTPDNAVTDTVKVSIPKSEAGGSGKLFGRLQVTKP